VRLVDLLEALGRLRVVGVAVGMVLLGEATERLLDLVRLRRLGNPERLILVALLSHDRQSSVPSRQ